MQAAEFDIGKTLLDLLFSDAGRVALIVGVVTLVLRTFRPRKRGRKPARNAAWLMARLKGQGFEKWVFVDLVLYLGLAAVFGLGAYAGLEPVADRLMPNAADYAFLYLPERDWTMLPAIFLAIALPGFLWLPVGRLIHGKRFRKYVLYMIARQNADTRSFIKWGCTSIAIVSIGFAILMGRAHMGVAGGKNNAEIVHQGVFALEAERHMLAKATALYLVMRRRAPNGNILSKPYLAMEFGEGQVWTSQWVLLGGPEGPELLRLARLLSAYTGLPATQRDFYGEDDTAVTDTDAL